MTVNCQFKNDLVWQKYSINRQDREKLNNHKGVILWFTGLSGSGKSTLANSLEQILYQYGIHTYLLDGDNIRHGLCCDLSFNDDDRRENIRRIGEVAKLMVDAGIIVLIACISPYRMERNMLRNMLTIDSFIEIFIDTPLTVCEKRDPKGLYKKVRDGKLHNFTGIDSIYEVPLQPDIKLNGEELITTSVNHLLKLLNERAIINS